MSLQRKLSRVNCRGLAAEFSKLHIAQRALGLCWHWFCCSQRIRKVSSLRNSQVRCRPRPDRHTRNKLQNNYKNWWRPLPSIPIHS